MSVDKEQAVEDGGSGQSEGDTGHSSLSFDLLVCQSAS